MNQYPIRTLTAILYLYACSILLVLAVTAAPVTTTTAIPHASCDFPQTPDAAFDFASTDDVPPVTYQFGDRSTSISGQPITSWKWTFGDGATSTEKNPQHTYAAAKTLENIGATLTVKTVCGKTDTTSTTFKVQCIRPQAGFTTDVSGGFAPLTVKITDTSAHTPQSVTKWEYKVTSDVGESSYSYPAPRNHQVTLRNPGNFTITQRVKKDCNVNSDTFSKDIRVSSLQMMYIATTTPTPTATSATTVTAGTTPSATVPVPVTTTSVPVTVAFTTPVTAPSLASITTAPAGSATTAPAGQTASGTGALSVMTNPPGVQVYIDEVAWGGSPATIPNLAAGAHTLRLEMAGYQSLSVPVTITDGKTAEYSLALVPVSSGGMGMMPLIIGLIVILALACAGAYLYRKKKKAP
jgi:hypothetical protein